MKGTMRILKYDNKKDVILVSIKSPHSLKSKKASFDRDLQFRSFDKNRNQLWIRETVDFYLTNPEFRQNLLDLFPQN